MPVRRVSLLSLVVGLLMAVVACGGVQVGASPIDEIDDFDALCAGNDLIGPKRTAFPEAGAYRGRKHPLVIMEHEGVHHPSSPDHWSVFYSNDSGMEFIEDPTSVQLVACAEHGEEYESVGACTFGRGETAEILRSSVKVTIFEARTAKKITAVTVDAAEHTCPSILWFQGEPTVYTSPTLREYREALTEAVPGIEIVS